MMHGLSIGCGPIRHPNGPGYYWTHIDIEPSHNPDVCMDALLISSRFGEDSVDFIESTHCIEHLAYPNDVVTFLKVAHHTLKPNGILRLAVPDLELVAKAYAAGDDLKFIYGAAHRGFYYKDCAAERFMYFARAWEHTVLFDYPLLSSLLSDAGFRIIRKCGVNESELPNWTHDRFPSESLYVECRK